MFDSSIRGPIADKFNPWIYPMPSSWDEVKAKVTWPEIKELALYVHIPFCEERCSYCHFTAYFKHDRTYLEKYINALRKEISLYKNHYLAKSTIVRTIYFGGGTPSLIDTEYLFDTMELLQDTFNFAPNFEFSLEANPCTLNSKKIQDLKILGVNRLSIGIQSFVNSELKSMNRDHSAQEAFEVIKESKKGGFHHINVDLIYGYPGQTKDSWEKSIDTAIELDPGRITCTALTVWPKTALYRRIINDTEARINERTDAEFFEIAFDKITNSGYKPFTSLSFSRDLNTVWQQQRDILGGRTSLLGLGLSALSCSREFLSVNVGSLSKYEKMLEQDTIPVEKIKFFEGKLKDIIRVVQSVKILNIDKDYYAHETGKDLSSVFSTQFENLKALGLVTENKERYELTKKGILYMGYVTRNFYRKSDMLHVNQYLEQHYFPLLKK